MLSVAEQNVVRRRGSLEQGRALEALGHAVEYLLDSRMFLTSYRAEQDSEAAVALLKRASCAVFAECPEVLPVRRKLSRWLLSRMPVQLAGRTQTDPAHAPRSSKPCSGSLPSSAAGRLEQWP